MKTTLISINAKYAHTNLAVRSIAFFARRQDVSGIDFAEFTINQRADFILSQLYDMDSDIYLFSCYIWNIGLVCSLARELHKIRPHAQLWAGGPEVSWNSETFLRENPAFSLVVRGEGEETVARLLSGHNTTRPLSGLTLRDADGSILQTPDATPPDMDLLPFPYPDLDQLSDRVLYYESIRGCPFRCSYCISSLERGVRLRSRELVQRDLQRLLDQQVKRVKFVDRTFNCDRDHAMGIWHYFQQNDNGVTNFHFELAGELLDQEQLDFLAKVRPGLFQFEIGVQSTHAPTLNAINRPAKLDRLFEAVERLRQTGNIHIHLDLIAGLPLEDYQTFQQSFNRVYGMQPHQLQLGFLKVLRGSPIERDAAQYGIICRDSAPYEVLSTDCLDYGELQLLKGMEEMLELYYNSGRFRLLNTYLCASFTTPFDYYHALAVLWEEKGYAVKPPGQIEQYEFLHSFMLRHSIPVTQQMQWLCKYDLLRRQRPNKLPAWIRGIGAAPDPLLTAFCRNREHMRDYLPHLAQKGSKDAARQTHIERFPFHPETNDPIPCVLLFDYSRRDLYGNAVIVTLPNCIFEN